QVANLDRSWVCPLSGEQRAPFARRKENGSVRIRSRERRADRRLHGRHKLESVGGEHTAKIRRDIAGHGVVSLAHPPPGSSSAASELLEPRGERRIRMDRDEMHGGGSFRPARTDV